MKDEGTGRDVTTLPFESTTAGFVIYRYSESLRVEDGFEPDGDRLIIYNARTQQHIEMPDNPSEAIMAHCVQSLIQAERYRGQ
jgi:hypothetical protein